MKFTVSSSSLGAKLVAELYGRDKAHKIVESVGADSRYREHKVYFCGGKFCDFHGVLC